MHQHQYVIDDAVWEMVRPLLASEPPRPAGGRPRVPDRSVLQGIVYVLLEGYSWADVPEEVGCGSRVTYWRRLREWRQAGVWPDIRSALIQRWQQSPNLVAADALLSEADLDVEHARRHTVTREACSRAGKKGGSTTRDRYGADHYRRIGIQGGLAARDTYGMEHYQRMGRVGGARSRGGRKGPRAAGQAAPGRKRVESSPSPLPASPLPASPLPARVGTDG